MKIKNVDLNINDAIDFANIDGFILKRRNNGFLFSDYQINILNRNGLNYEKYSNLHDLLFDIEECLNSDYDEDLDVVGSQIAELLYYKETKK